MYRHSHRINRAKDTEATVYCCCGWGGVCIWLCVPLNLHVCEVLGMAAPKDVVLNCSVHKLEHLCIFWDIGRYTYHSQHLFWHTPISKSEANGNLSSETSEEGCHFMLQIREKKQARKRCEYIETLWNSALVTVLQRFHKVKEALLLSTSQHCI